MSLEQLYKILLSEKPSELIKEHEDDIFDMIPELKVCKGFNQNNVWHIYDVYEHILHVVDNVDKDISLRLSALFHDIAKPKAYTEHSNGVGHFPFHWVESAKIFDRFVGKYNVDVTLAEQAKKLIFFHDANREKLNEALDAFDSELIKKLFNLKRADLLAQNPQFHYMMATYHDLEIEALENIKKR